MNEALEHQSDEGQGDHGLGDVGAFFIILGQAPPSAQPSQGPLDHPPPRNDDEATAGDAPDDDQGQPEQEAGEDHRQAVVDAVGEDDLEPAIQPFDPRQQVTRAVGVLDVGGVDEDAEQQAGGVDGDVALAPLDLLGRVEAANAPFSVVLTLWVSMTAALGVGARPSCSRSITTR